MSESADIIPQIENDAAGRFVNDRPEQFLKVANDIIGEKAEFDICYIARKNLCINAWDIDALSLYPILARYASPCTINGQYNFGSRWPLDGRNGAFERNALS